MRATRSEGWRDANRFILLCLVIFALVHQAACGSAEDESDALVEVNTSSVAASVNQFSKCYGIGDFNSADPVAWVSNTEIVIGGGYYNGDVIYDTDQMDAFGMKIDGRGNVVWQEVRGGPNQDNIRFILPDDEGGCVLLGRYDEDRPGEIYAKVALWYMDLDKDGNIVQEHRISRNGSLQAWAAVDLATGGIAVAGEISEGLGISSCMMMILDGDGNVVLEREYSSPYSMSWVNSITETSEGDLVLAGSSGELADFHGWARLVDRQGETIWFQEFDDLAPVEALMPLPNGGVVLMSESDDPEGLKLFELDREGESTTWEIYIEGGEHASTAVLSGSTSYFCVKKSAGQPREYALHVYRLDSELNLEDLGVVETAVGVGYSTRSAVAVSPNGEWIAVYGDGFTESGQNQVVWLTTVSVSHLLEGDPE